MQPPIRPTNEDLSRPNVVMKFKRINAEKYVDVPPSETEATSTDVVGRSPPAKQPSLRGAVMTESTSPVKSRRHKRDRERDRRIRFLQKSVQRLEEQQLKEKYASGRIRPFYEVVIVEYDI